MLRFIYVIVMRTFSIIYYVPMMAHYARHPERYSEERCYALAQKLMDKVRHTSRITTEYEGKENLPRENGYLLAANHQGKYDSLGVILGHDRPCSVLMDKKRYRMPIAKQLVDMLGGQRIERNSPRQQIRVINAMAQEIREGRNYLVFPEGGYGKKRDNSLGEFKYGCFVSAVKAQCPIVPVVLIDCYKPFGLNSLRRVQTKVIYLPPIAYAEYEGMKPREVCALVRERIAAEIKRQELVRAGGGTS